MMVVLQTKMCFECLGREEAMQDMTNNWKGRLDSQVLSWDGRKTNPLCGKY